MPNLDEAADLSLFHIPNYSCVARGFSCSQHGGLATYIHQSYNFDCYETSFKPNTWESLVVKILSNNNNNIQGLQA